MGRTTSVSRWPSRGLAVLLALVVVQTGLPPSFDRAAAAPSVGNPPPGPPAPPGPPPGPIPEEARKPLFVPPEENGVRNPTEGEPALGDTVNPQAAVAQAKPRPQKGGPNFDVFSVAGGDHLALVYPHEVNVQDAQGNWARASYTLVGGPTSWTGATAEATVAFPRTLSPTQRVSFTIDEGSLATVPSDLPAAGVQGVRDKETVTYADARKATDFIYALTPYGYKEQVVLKTAEAGSALSWEIDATGLTLAEGEGGQILILAGTEQVGFIPTPVAYDSSAELKDSVPTASLVDLGGGSYRIALQLDQSFLDQATYPVVVDPGDATKYPVRDGYVNQASPSSSYEGSTYLKVGDGKRTFLKFDTSGIQRDGRITYGAELYLAVAAQNSKATGVNYKRVTDFWPTTLTWNSQPAADSGTSEAPSAAVGQWLKADVVNTYQGYLDNTWPDHGVRFGSTDEKTFYASEYGDPGRPTLLLSWNDLPNAPKPLSPGDGAFFETESPTLKLENLPWDPNGDDVLIQYQVSDDPDNWTDPNLKWESAWTDEKHYIVPAGVLTDGQTYWWRARSWDVCAKPDTPCTNKDGTGVWHPLNASSPKSFTISLKHFGEDPKYPMWSQSLGNDMTLKVNQSNGNLFLDVPLDTLSTPVDDLAMGLSYNHQQASNEGLGTGWDIAAGPASAGRELPVRLRELDNEGVRIRFRDGSFAFFPERSKRVFAAGGAGSVKKSSDGSYTYVTPDSGVYTFGMNGRLVEAKPAATAAEFADKAFSYTFNTAEELTKVTDALGRAVTFTWTAGKPTSITTWDGRTWTMTYGERLQTVRTPAGETLTFIYVDGRLAQIRDGQQTALNQTGWQMAYADFGGTVRVDKITPPGLAATEYWDFWYDGPYKGRTASTAKVTDPRGTATGTVDDYTTIGEFNWAGLPIRMAGPTDATGAWPVTRQVWDSHNNLVCKREPYANAVVINGGSETKCQGEATADPLNTEYKYDKQPPYRLTSVTHPAPNADGTGSRAKETYEYDNNWNFRGLWAEQFNNASMSGIPAGEGLWTEFDRNWGDGSPPAITRVDNWSMRWTGYLEITETADYAFRLYSNDGASLTVANETLTDCFGADNNYDDYNCGTNKDKKKKLWPGKKPITIEFQDKTGPARFTLKWDKGGTWGVIQPLDLSPNLGLVTKKSGPTMSTTYAYPNDDAISRRLPASETDTDLTGKAAARKTTYAYDEYGRVTSVTDPLGKVTTSTYTGACLIKKVDRTGAESRFECNGAGDVTKTTQVIRGVTGPAGQPSQPAQDRVTLTTYDPLGRVDVVSAGLAGAEKLVTDTDYDLAGRPKTTKDNKGNTTAYQYDAQGRLQKETLPDPDGAGSQVAPVIQHFYDPVGNETRRIDARGSEWATGYDALNRVTVTRNPLCTLYGDANPGCDITSTAYSLATRTVTVTDPGGVAAVTTNDLLGRRVSEKVGTLAAATYQYDVVGNETRVTDPAAVWTEKTYDGFGQVLTEKTAHELQVNAITTFTYDGGGRLKTVDGPRTNVADATTYNYDPEGRITSVVLPLPQQQATTSYVYSDAGELLRVTDGDLRVRSWTFDARGRMDSASDARGTTTYVYDDLSRLMEVRLPTGVTQKFEYDNLGRRTRRYGVSGGATADNETFTYDKAGNLLTASNGAGTVTVAYDEAARQKSVTAPDGAGRTATTTFSYASGRLQSRTDPAGTTSFTYNPNGQLATLTDPFGGRSDYAYDDAGRTKSRTTGALVTTRVYDAVSGHLDSQTTTAGSTEVAHFELGHDLADNVTSKTARVAAWPAAEKGTWAYTYDAAGRMVTATDPAGVKTTYGYDGAGNRTSVQVGSAAAVTTAYDGAGHPDSASDGTDYTTDATGAVTKVSKELEVKSFTYDTWSRLAKADLPSGNVVTYGYDALDRTVTRTKGTNRIRLTYAGAVEQVAASIQESVVGGAVVSGSQVTTSYGHSPGGPLAQKTGTALRYLVRDLHGDVVGLVDSGGASKGTSSSEASLLGYQGQLTDPDSGQVDMTTRLYEPALGRFLTRDAVFGDVKDPVTLNQFLYGGSSPITHDDPLGLCHTEVCADNGGTFQPESYPAPPPWSSTTYFREAPSYEPPRPKAAPRLNFTIADFAARTPQQRLNWLQDFQAYFRTRGWFNAQESVLRFFVRRGMGIWSSWVDASILHSIQSGGALRLGKGVPGNENIRSARIWNSFLVGLERGRPTDQLKRMWAQAEQAATDYGVKIATARARPSTLELSVLAGSQVFRDGVGHPAAARDFATSAARHVPPLSFMPFADDPVAFFDPRNGAAVSEGLGFIQTGHSFCPVCAVMDWVL